MDRVELAIRSVAARSAEERELRRHAADQAFAVLLAETLAAPPPGRLTLLRLRLRRWLRRG